MIRKLTLSEWFLDYQLSYIFKKGNHLPAFIDVDLSNIIDSFEDNKKIPMTTIIIKAASLWQKKCPAINRHLFKSIFGNRIYSCDELSVNVPVVLDSSDGPYTSAMVISHANTKSISDIKAEIKTFLKTNPADLPVGKYIIGKDNTVFNRFRLKFIHFLVNSTSKMYQAKSVGTISVSSLLNLPYEKDKLAIAARGAGAVTITIASMDLVSKKAKIAISWDHSTAQGFEGVSAMNEFIRILEGADDAEFKQLLS